MAVSYPAGLQWEAEPYPAIPAKQAGFIAWRILVLCVFLFSTAVAISTAWMLLRPATVVQTRIGAEAPGPSGRAALAEASLRITTAVDRSVTLDDHGEALVVTVSAADPAAAQSAAHAAADALLNLLPVTVSDPAQSSPSPPVAVDRASVEHSSLTADRNRLQAALEAADAQLSTVSASLTGIVRDLAANAHAATERKPGQDTLEKAATALADLQLQRIQLQSHYQDDYPAVVVLNGQIRALRTFMQEEEHRASLAASHAPADAGLSSERDRLRAELTRLGDRRIEIATNLNVVMRALAQAPQQHVMPLRPDPGSASMPVLSPLLIEGATVMTSGPDSRWLVASALGAVGLLLTLLAWFKPVHSYQPASAKLIVQQRAMLMLPPSLAPTLHSSNTGAKLADENPAVHAQTSEI